MNDGLAYIVDTDILSHKKVGGIKVVGMDCDGILTNLHEPWVYKLLWENLLSFLPSELKSRFEERSIDQIIEESKFSVGRFLDIGKGYLVLPDQNGRILAVKRGNEKLTREKFVKIYGTNTIDVSLSLDPDHSRTRFLLLCDAFDYIEGVIRSAMASTNGLPRRYTTKSLQRAFYQSHHSESGFREFFLRELKEELKKVENKSNYDQLRSFLEQLHSRYTTFLLTNSPRDYVMRLLSQLGIQGYFDKIITDAKKPACFMPGRSENSALWKELNSIGVFFPQDILYIGDHLYKDAALAHKSGFFTGLRMKREDVNEVMRKLNKYADLEFERDGSIVEPINVVTEKGISRLNYYLALLYNHVDVLTTKVQNLKPILLY